MAWLRRRFRIFRGVADAVSRADTGPYAGAPRNPRQRAEDGDKAYAVVRYTTQHLAYTATGSTPDLCERCGRPVGERHEIEYVEGDGERVALGGVRVCRNCEADSWLLRSRMPAARRARETARKHVV